MAAPTDLELAIAVGTVFESLGLRYLIGGSLASSLHGVPRSSNDADLLAELPWAHVDEFVRRLEADFYIDGDMIRDSIRRGISFNLIHYASSFKVDVFVLTDDAFGQAEMQRRQLHDTGRGAAHFATAEDMVLQKLRWYRAGGESSERQWLDVLGILKVKATRLDLDYARPWADRIGVRDLLDRALADALGSS